MVVRALELAEDITRRLRLLLDALVEAGGAAGRISTALLQTGERIRAATPGVRSAGDVVYRDAVDARAPLLIEAGRQLTVADQHRDGWPETPR